MKMLLFVAMLVVASVAHANPALYPKENIAGAPAACHEVLTADTRLSWTALFVLNKGTTNSDVACSPTISTSTNGTTAFGAVISNAQNNNRTFTCTAKLSTGGNGPAAVTHSVTVGPNTSARIGWSATDLGETKGLVGGQVGFVCTLLPGSAISWVWNVTTQG